MKASRFVKPTKEFPRLTAITPPVVPIEDLEVATAIAADDMAVIDGPTIGTRRLDAEALVGPKGDPGQDGQDGANGQPGQANILSVSQTVTVAPDQPAF